MPGRNSGIYMRTRFASPRAANDRSVSAWRSGTPCRKLSHFITGKGY